MLPEAPEERVGSRRDGAAAGLSGVAAAIVLLALTHIVLVSVPFAPVAVAQALVRAAPGWLATFFIDLLGHGALPLLTVCTLAGSLAAGALLGSLVPRLQGWLGGRTFAASLSVFVPAWLLAVVLYPTGSAFASRASFALATLPALVIGAVVCAWTLGRLTGSSPPDPDLTRRYLVRSLWLGVVGLALGATGLGRFTLKDGGPPPGPLSLPNVSVEPIPSSPASSDTPTTFAHVAGLTPEVTASGDFYVVDEAIVDPSIDASTWKLSVTGLVSNPLSLSYDDLKSMPAVERYQTLECISNWVGGPLISNARWVGIPIRDILDRANVDGGATQVVFRSADGYSDSLSMEQVMDPTTLLAIGMNGTALPRAHGYPARVLSVNTYGMKNPKWVTSMEVVNQPYDGFWEQRGWSSTAIVNTESRIDTPRDGDSLHGEVPIAGLAFAGSRGISKVEVSTDGGKTWNEAQLDVELSPYSWRRWLYVWAPPNAGTYSIGVRATDGDGATQVESTRSPHPDGATGYHAISVSAG